MYSNLSYCPRHNHHYIHFEGCPHCDSEPAYLKQYIEEATDELLRMQIVAEQYENIIQQLKSDSRLLIAQIEQLEKEHDEIENTILNLDYDIEQVKQDEVPAYYILNEIAENEFVPFELPKNPIK